MAAYKWRWTAPIQRETLPALQALAARLGFVVTGNNAFTGQASPADLLDAIATRFDADPDGTAATLAAMLDDNGLLPAKPAPPDAAE